MRQVATAAKLRCLIAMLATVVAASCGYLHRSAHSKVEVTPARTWLLLVAPFTREFPHGNLEAPFSKWSLVRAFDTAAGCDAILEQAEDYLQRPVQCIASDDQRLKGPPAGPDAKP